MERKSVTDCRTTKFYNDRMLDTTVHYELTILVSTNTKFPIRGGFKDYRRNWFHRAIKFILYFKGILQMIRVT